MKKSAFCNSMSPVITLTRKRNKLWTRLKRLPFLFYHCTKGNSKYDPCRKKIYDLSATQPASFLHSLAIHISSIRTAVIEVPYPIFTAYLHVMSRYQWMIYHKIIVCRSTCTKSSHHRRVILLYGAITLSLLFTKMTSS